MSDSADAPNSSSFVGWSITLLISLVLHGTFLVLPMPSGSQAEEPEEPEEQEETVKVTKLPSVAPPPVQPPPRKLPPRPKVERKVVVQPLPQAVRPPAPRPQLTPEPPKEPEPSPSPEATPTPEPTKPPESAPRGGASPDLETPPGPTESELQAMRQQALDQIYDNASQIEGAQAFKAAIIDPSTLDQPQAFFTEESIAGDEGLKLRPHLREPTFFDNKQAEEVHQLVQASPEWSNLESLGNYGGGLLFKATRAADDQTEEDVTYYLNIVSNNSIPTSTYLFFWDKNPNEA